MKKFLSPVLESEGIAYLMPELRGKQSENFATGGSQLSELEIKQFEDLDWNDF